MSMPSLTLLESFTTTAREGSFAKAAIRLGVSASAVGKAIARFEEELGITLFQRSTRHLELTEEGRLLLSGLSPAMSALDDAIERVRDKKERIAGHLTLTVPWWAIIFSMIISGRFYARIPKSISKSGFPMRWWTSSQKASIWASATDLCAIARSSSDAFGPSIMGFSRLRIT